MEDELALRNCAKNALKLVLNNDQNINILEKNIFLIQKFSFFEKNDFLKK